jgi:hypothetical protein
LHLGGVMVSNSRIEFSGIYLYLAFGEWGLHHIRYS